MADDHHRNLLGHHHHHHDEDENEVHAPNSEGTYNPHASANRWRHQESASFARHAAARDDENSLSDTRDLSNFLNASRIAPASATGPTAAVDAPAAATGSTDSSTGKFRPIVVPPGVDAAAGAPVSQDDGTSKVSITNAGDIIAGPLLNYRRMEDENWIGSVLIVTRLGGPNPPEDVPRLVIGPAGTGIETAETAGPGTTKQVRGFCLYSDPRCTFWRFDVSVPLGKTQAQWQYSLPDMRYESKTKPRTSIFTVPAVTEAMRILFFSCNGFSVGTDEEAFCGPALWNDVLRVHKKAPFHVMIGGGDQIYNDGIRVNGPLKEWTAIGNPKKRREFAFPETMRQRCDDYYLKNYIRWYSTEPFATANGQIAQLNIWDDHDIIDGFGSYVNEFMKCDVFRGIGGAAFKYYLLFQHHLPPPQSTYTSDAPQTGHQTVDTRQLIDTYVAPAIIEPNYIIGSKPGPYVAERSLNMYAKLGARMAFLGIDARTERTRHQVNYPETYDLIFNRLDEEFKAAAALGEPVRHLILLLGIPIAYPRLTWLENVFSSPVMGPMKFMNRRFGFGGGFFNYFDGSVDLLDDLDDHYTAHTHKKERNAFVERLQTVSEAHSVRITILSGDVHLAALGRFYSNPNLGIPVENDPRFVVNVVSSAITNKPPPAAIANLLSRRNKIHHLNHATDETLFKLFDKDPGDSSKTASHNQVTMPSRNFAVITENSPYNAPASNQDGTAGGAWQGNQGEGGGSQPTTGSGSGGKSSQRAGFLRSKSFTRLRRSANETGESSTTNATHGTNGTGETNGTHETANASSANGTVSEGGGHQVRPASSTTGYSAVSSSRESSSGRVDGHYALHAGEENAGTKHRATGEQHGQLNDGSLDVCIMVEIDQHDRNGRTEGYGMSIPALDYTAPPPVPAIPQKFQ